MELGKDNASGLLLAGDEAAVDSACYLKILQQAFYDVGDHHNKGAQGSAAPQTSPMEKKCIFAFCGFIVDCARIDVSLDEIRAILEENGLGSSRTQTFLDMYKVEKDSIRAMLTRVTSFARPKLVDVNWRLDYNIKSSQGDKVNQLSYLVNLHTQDPSEDNGKVLDFTCSLEQLQDLVGKLKDAVRCVEKQAAA